MFGLRLGNPRVVVATTPRPTKLIRDLGRAVVYDLLFRTAPETLLTIAANPGIWAPTCNYPDPPKCQCMRGGEICDLLSITGARSNGQC
jgi:hypothetical protein